MSDIASSTTAEALQQARAAHLRDLFEPWTLRKLEARTGIGRGKLETRFNGKTDLTFSDIAVLAPVIRMSPEELFAELLSIQPENRKGPASEETGLKVLPHLDSNQEPAGFTPAPIPLVPRRGAAARTAGDAIVTPLLRKAN